MLFIIRQPGDRRWGFVNEFPLKDRDGVFVLFDRRSGSERRKVTLSADDFLMLLSRFPAIESAG
jgi:hypothetical protein